MHYAITPLITPQNQAPFSLSPMAVTRADINNILRDTSNGAANISSHSLRIGAASTAAAMGCPKYLIQSMGRWSSDCFRRYIRLSDTTIRNTSRAMARCNIPIPLDFDPRM